MLLTNEKQWRIFYIESDTRQSCVLAPSLFNIRFFAGFADALKVVDQEVCIIFRFNGNISSLCVPKDKTKNASMLFISDHVLVAPASSSVDKFCYLDSLLLQKQQLMHTKLSTEVKQIFILENSLAFGNNH